MPRRQSYQSASYNSVNNFDDRRVQDLDCEITALKLRLEEAERARGEWKTKHDRVQTQLEQANVEVKTLKEEISNSHRPELASVKRNLGAVEELLHHFGHLPFMDLLRKVDQFNEAVSSTADFLVKNVVYRIPEVFQVELHRARDETQSSIGGQLTDLLVSQSKISAIFLGRPSPSIIRNVLQIFIINHCVSEIERCSWYTADVDESGKSSERRSPRCSSPPSTLEDFKSSFLLKLASLLKVAAWLLPGAKHRTAFEEMLDPLYRSREELRIALEGTFKSTDIHISVVDDQASFIADYMVPIDGVDVETSTAQGISGTVRVGLKIAVKGQSTSDICFKNVLHAQVVLESALRHKTTPDGFGQQESHQPTLPPAFQDGRADSEESPSMFKDISSNERYELRAVDPKLERLPYSYGSVAVNPAFWGDRPLWPLSSSCEETTRTRGLDISPEEMRLKSVTALNIDEYLEFEASQISIADRTYATVTTLVAPAYIPDFSTLLSGKPAPGKLRVRSPNGSS